MYNEYHDYHFNSENETHEDESQMTSHTPRPNRRTRRKARKGFGRTLGRGVAIAVICGLVGGGAFTGVYTVGSHLANKAAVSASSENTADASGSASDTSKTSLTTGSTDSAQSLTLGSTNSSSEELSTVDVASRTMPSMVAITNVSVTEVQNYFDQFGSFGGFGSYGSSEPQTQETTSAGSGEIIYEDDNYLYIATNQHVIENATTLTAAFSDDSVAEAEVVGEDATNDLAVIKVAKSDLSDDTLKAISVISIGKSSDLSVGQDVVAIGNALGYGQSVSEGIVSALNRSLNGGSGVYATGLIQTDAAINPGNSGGALLNKYGQLVGINSAKYSSTEIEGMGYSIPIDTAYPIFESMINGTYSASDGTAGNYETGNGDAYLGVSCAGVSEDYASYYNIPEGVYIKEATSGGAAANAGIQAGDIITALDGKSVTSVSDLSALLSQHSSGETITVTLSRADASGSYTSMDIKVTLGSRNA